jgi:Cdc6-like AAA superfamily ATPase
MADAGAGPFPPPPWDRDQRIDLEVRIKHAFSPHAPIDRLALFSGRLEQIRAVTNSVLTPGLHAVVYGERGVGKTSLTNLIKEILEQIDALARVNCTKGDSFNAVIRRTLDGLALAVPRRVAGFLAEPEEIRTTLNQLLPSGRISADRVADVLSALPAFTVLVIDEFDRLERPARAPFADLIKALSDRGAKSTIVLVGVAEDVNDLVADHASIERSLRQIRLPRMSVGELETIIIKGLEQVPFYFETEDTSRRIVSISQGFPHYTHLLAHNAALSALDAGRLAITADDLGSGMAAAVRDDQTRWERYSIAVTGTRRNSLWREVVAACALSDPDERGYFASRAVQDKLSQLLGRPVIQETFAFHLGKLIEDSRGPLLERTGPERRYRYRFIDPLMRPFVLMKAAADGLSVEAAMTGRIGTDDGAVHP